MDLAKVKTIADWPYPQTLPALQGFLGLSNFYRHFIPCYSDIVAPLTALTGKNVDTHGKLKDTTCVKAFTELHNLFTSAPFPLHFDFAKPRMIHVDSSGVALSAILLQTDSSGKLWPVAYISLKLTPAECKWQVHNQELGAIIATFLKWCSWLAGTLVPVAVMSNHANLQYFMTSKVLMPRQAHWASLLSMYNFEILHTPGKTNPADPASCGQLHK
ncbi:hypothetical protein CROQUDRAFT_94126 [Cronartium quercuum f. sp. fusiforme G11]|uniref:Reverse transcriptase RNase H-like domain-containing protein n=1 Tax=Cronartium quercuum f. sp. fusiforme G11 TaxID=708437 RepID=A0A9P6NJN7_9BASI|nr:hypothetical protein CROQUDRAFT_94126 [Cronartium quercuum f. sp. fusiforme G11]